MAQRLSSISVKAKYTSREIDQGFNACFQQYWSRVYGILYRLVNDPDEAEDLALETFWRFYCQINARKTPIENPGGWLYRVALRLGYNLLRSRKRRAHYEQEVGMYAIQNASSEDPIEAIVSLQQRERVRQILSRIRKQSAQLLILRHSGLSYAEVADVLKIRVGSVGTLLSRAEREFELEYQAFEEKIR